MAQRPGRVGVGKPHASRCQRINVRRGDLGSRVVTARIAVTHIVGEDQQNVGILGGEPQPLLPQQNSDD